MTQTCSIKGRKEVQVEWPKRSTTGGKEGKPPGTFPTIFRISGLASRVRRPEGTGHCVEERGTFLDGVLVVGVRIEFTEGPYGRVVHREERGQWDAHGAPDPANTLWESWGHRMRQLVHR